jgi:hypothetical protein
MRDAVRQLVTLNPELDFEAPTGYTITDQERVRRLQDDCLRRITRERISERERDAEKHRIADALKLIDPGRPPRLIVPARQRSRPIQPGEPVNLSATAAGLDARGLKRASYQLCAVPSQAGHPLVGVAIEPAAHGAVVTPAPRPAWAGQSSAPLDPQIRATEPASFYFRSLDGSEPDDGPT